MQLPNTEEHFYITAENQKTISVYAYHKEQFFYEETCWEGGHPNPNPSLPPREAGNSSLPLDGAKAEHGFTVAAWTPSAKDCLKVCSLR